MESAITGSVRLFCDVRATISESIVWDPDRSLLWFTDIALGLLQAAGPDGTVAGSAPLPPPLASFQPRASGGFVAALQNRVVLTDPDGRLERTVTTIEHASPGMRLNEGKCDPFGRFIVGSMVIDDNAPNAALYSVDPDGTTRLLRGGFGITNGFEWSDDGSVMYVTDTETSTIYRGSYGPDGELGELEPFIVGGKHDGLVRDDEGCFWSALNGASKVGRYGPDGAELEIIDVPVSGVTSVALGGADMSTLFIGSSRENLTEEQIERQPTAGSLYAVPTRVHGRPAFTFDA